MNYKNIIMSPTSVKFEFLNVQKTSRTSLSNDSLLLVDWY